MVSELHVIYYDFFIFNCAQVVLFSKSNENTGNNENESWNIGNDNSEVELERSKINIFHSSSSNINSHALEYFSHSSKFPGTSALNGLSQVSISQIFTHNSNVCVRYFNVHVWLWWLFSIFCSLMTQKTTPFFFLIYLKWMWQELNEWIWTMNDK